MRGGETSNRGSPSSLFSAPSSPAPIHPQPATRQPPPPMPSLSSTNGAGPSRRPPPGSQVKVTRKPNWLIQPKIKRFDAPNLKPSSSLPTKASLAGAARSSEGPQSPTSSIQTPTSTTTLRPPFTLDESSGLALDSDMDVIQQSQAHSSPHTEPQVPLLPPASRMETEAFLNDIMPPECVYSSLHFVQLAHTSSLP
jgi:hypothetical protein